MCCFVPSLSFVKPVPSSIKSPIADSVNTFDQIQNYLFSRPRVEFVRNTRNTPPLPSIFAVAGSGAILHVTSRKQTSSLSLPRPKRRRSERDRESNGQRVSNFANAGRPRAPGQRAVKDDHRANLSVGSGHG